MRHKSLRRPDSRSSAPRRSKQHNRHERDSPHEFLSKLRELPEAVSLVIVLGKCKTAVVDDLRMDSLAALLLDPGFGIPGKPQLLIVMHEDDGGVLARPAPVRRIVAGPEGAEQFLVGYPGGIVVDLDGLCVVAKRAVGWILFGPAGISHARPDYAGQTPEPGVGSPESAHGKGCSSDLFRREGIDQGFRCRRCGSQSIRAHGMLPPFCCEINCPRGKQEQEQCISGKPWHVWVLLFDHGIIVPPFDKRKQDKCGADKWVTLKTPE